MLPEVVLDDAVRFTPRDERAICAERIAYLGDGTVDGAAEAMMRRADQRGRDAQQQRRKRRRFPALDCLGPDRPNAHPLHCQLSEPLQFR